LNLIDIPIGEIKHIHLSAGLSYIAEDREWVATTINKEIDFLMTIFNWFEIEDYVIKNPSKGKFIKLPVNKTKHRWYDRDLFKKIVEAIAPNEPLLRACQFTYELMIRSKKELRKLKVGDIDRTLKRVRFSADLSKNSTEAYRDYGPEFEQMIKEMQLHKYPNHFYVFGSGNGQPGIKQCGHNYFSKMFMAVKTKLELSMDYTVYGFKHTRIVHELMKGTDGQHIGYMARHTDRKSTKDYMRDYDITLVNIYGPEDLKFYKSDLTLNVIT
jgi:integrase